MKRLFLIALVPVALLSFSSCDFVRKVAGRPTSAEIETMRSRKEAAIEAERVAKENKARESLQKKNEEALSTIAGLGVQFKNASALSVKLAGELPSKYIIIVGAFSKESNARRLSDEITSSGHKAVILDYTNGNKAVGVDPCDSPVKLMDRYLEVSGEKYCPLEAWILVNE